MPLSETEIAARLTLGKNFIERFARNDRTASAKFRDASNLPGYIALDDDYNDLNGGDVPVDTPVGQSNLLATNVITKTAAIAVGDPDFHVKVSSGDADRSNIVREFLRAKWKLYGWVRLSQKTMQKRFVGGLGCLAYRWDQGTKDRPGTRSTFEHVQSWELAVDPNVRDWQALEWGARRISMSLRNAKERYPDADFPEQAEGSASPDATKIVIWLYYDRDVEAHIWNDKVIESDDNLYKCVPFLFYEGDIDPGTSVWPLSDWILASGLQAELSDLNLSISNSAKHGGPLNMVDTKRLSPAGRTQLENGIEQGYIDVDDLVTPPIMRLAGEPLSPALIEAKREAQSALDSITGVNQYQRGVINQGVEFATEAALIGNQSGARAIQSRLDFERFLNKMAETVVLLEAAFGGPDADDPEQHTDEQLILWEALQEVVEVHVLEASTTYKDPAYELQQGMQLLNLAANLFPLFAQTGQPTPNLQQYLDDVLRAAGKYDMSRYWMAPLPPPPMAGPNGRVPGTGDGTDGMNGPGGAPAAPGGGDGSLPPGNVPTA